MKNVGTSLLEPKDTQVKSHCCFENQLADASYTEQLPAIFKPFTPGILLQYLGEKVVLILLG